MKLLRAPDTPTAIVPACWVCWHSLDADRTLMRGQVVDVQMCGAGTRHGVCWVRTGDGRLYRLPVCRVRRWEGWE